MRRLRDSMKASMVTALNELQNMQQLQDLLKQSRVSLVFRILERGLKMAS